MFTSALAAASFIAAAALTIRRKHREKQSPLFTFGVIADIQYADADDAWDYHKLYERLYRDSLNSAKAAVQTWNERAKVDNMLFAIQLGDAIDGKNKRTKNERKALNTVLEILNQTNSKIYHTIGNHELYCFDRKTLNGLLDMKDSFYYSFVPTEGWRCIILDSYDLSLLGVPKDDPNYLEALRILQERNKNNVLENGDWLVGMKGEERRWLPYNGAFSQKQLKFLQTNLQEATDLKQKIMIFSHIPIYAPASQDNTVLWNNDEVFKLIHSHPGVVAYFAGHEHQGGFAIDKNGVAHITLESPLETPRGKVSYGYVKIYHDRLIVRGSGNVPNREVYFPCPN